MLVNKNLIIKKITSALISVLLLSGLVACSTKTPPATQPTYFNHTVKFSGETLAVIAAWYTGAAKNWQLLAAANPELKPTRIKIGDVIKIPSDLITRFEPLPKKLLKALPSKEQRAEQPKSDSKTAPSKAEEQSKPVTTTEEPTPTIAETTNAADTVPTSPTVAIVTSTPDPADEMVPAFEEDIVIEPTPESKEASVPTATLSPEDKAREDLIDEILRK